MTDISDRIRSALEGRYTIDREIGRGGMACQRGQRGQYPRRRNPGRFSDISRAAALVATRQAPMISALRTPHAAP